MKGISPFISAVLLIAVVVAVGAILSTWYTSLIKTQGSIVGQKATQSTQCSYGGIRVQTETIECNFSGNGTPANPEILSFNVENSGSINLYDLRVQVYVGGVTYTFDLYDVVTNQTFTSANPLKPDEVKTVRANISQDLPLADADWLEVLTQCPGVTSGQIPDIDCTP